MLLWYRFLAKTCQSWLKKNIPQNQILSLGIVLSPKMRSIQIGVLGLQFLGPSLSCKVNALNVLWSDMNIKRFLIKCYLFRSGDPCSMGIVWYLHRFSSMPLFMVYIVRICIVWLTYNVAHNIHHHTWKWYGILVTLVMLPLYPPPPRLGSSKCELFSFQ